MNVELPEYKLINLDFLSELQIVCLRGLPGSGKSTFAKFILKEDEKYWSDGEYRYDDFSPFGGWVNCEADKYFIRPDGEYDFNKRLIGQAHAWCLCETERNIKLACSVIVSNTFSTKKELEPYKQLAVKLKIPFRVIECTGKFKNIHNVPEETLRRMQERWERI